jgi:hypothetical protein
VSDVAGSAGSAGTASRSDHTHFHGNLAGGSLHALASTLSAGFMSAADKLKLDSFDLGVATGNVLVWNAVSSRWEAGTLDLADPDGVSGILGIANGGTGLGALGAANTVLRVNAGATALEYALLTSANLSPTANIVGSQLSASANIAASQLAPGAAGTVLSGGSPNTFTATPQVTSILCGASTPTGATLTSAALTFGKDVGAPAIAQSAKTDDTAPQVLTLRPQAPFASATGTNRDAPSLVVALSASVGGSTAVPGLKVTYAGNFSGQLGPLTVSPALSAIWLGPGMTPTGNNFCLASNGATATYLNAPTGGTLYLLFNGSASQGVAITASALTLTTPTDLRWAEGVAAPTISQAARTTDAAPQDLTLKPQAPFATATGVNRNPANLVVDLSAPTAGGTAEGSLRVTRAGSFVAQVGPYPGFPTTYTALWMGPGITPNTSNYMFLADNTGGNTQINSPAPNGTFYFSFSGSAKLTLTANACAWYEAVTNPTFKQNARTTDAAPQNLTLSPQAPYASATGTNKNPGSLVVDLAVPVGGSTTEAALRVTRAGTFVAQIGPYPGAPSTYSGLWLGPGITPSGTNYVFVGDNLGVASYFNTPNLSGSMYFTFAGSASYGLALTQTILQWAVGTSNPVIRHAPRTTDAATTSFTLAAQDAFSTATTNKNGGSLILRSGAKATGGVDGNIDFYNGATLSMRLDASAGLAIGGAGSFAGGVGVISIANAATAPTGTPTGGGVLFASSGNLYWRDSSGVTTQLN